MRSRRRATARRPCWCDARVIGPPLRERWFGRLGVLETFTLLLIGNAVPTHRASRGLEYDDGKFADEQHAYDRRLVAIAGTSAAAIRCSRLRSRRQSRHAFAARG